MAEGRRRGGSAEGVVGALWRAEVATGSKTTDDGEEGHCWEWVRKEVVAEAMEGWVVGQVGRLACAWMGVK
eukprot:6197136-Pleurochrysis_carterae.AAC.2